jgi:hypothetical protein
VRFTSDKLILSTTSLVVKNEYLFLVSAQTRPIAIAGGQASQGQAQEDKFELAICALSLLFCPPS